MNLSPATKAAAAIAYIAGWAAMAASLYFRHGLPDALFAVAVALLAPVVMLFLVSLLPAAAAERDAR